MSIVDSRSAAGSLEIEQQSIVFLSSGFLFRMGLALETFEQVRPLGIEVSDYFFLSSLLLILCYRKGRLLKSKGSGVLLAGAMILCGSFLSLLGSASLSSAARPLLRVIILFGLFAPLAVAHSKNIRGNMQFLMGGVSLNCVIAMLAAWVSPGIADALAINPVVDPAETGQSIGRFAGLAGHPNILGLSAALAVLIGVGLLFSERKIYVAWGLLLQVLVCTVAALLSGSRTFFVSLVPGLIVLGFAQKLHFKLIVRVLVVFIVVCGAINYLAPEEVSEYIDRLGSATGAADNENYGRLLTAGTALLEISQKPIVGWGVDRFGEAGMTFVPWDNEVVPTHNSFLQYWYAIGVLGAIGFLALFAVPAKRMLQDLKTKSSGDLANALRVGLGVYMLLFIASNLHPILFNRFLFVPLFVFGGLAARTAGPIEARKVVRKTALNLSAQISRLPPERLGWVDSE